MLEMVRSREETQPGPNRSLLRRATLGETPAPPAQKLRPTRRDGREFPSGPQDTKLPTQGTWVLSPVRELGPTRHRDLEEPNRSV